MELERLLLQGREQIESTSRAHAERWGLGSARRWALDQDEGLIMWSFADHVATAPAQILGSWNSQVATFVWSWDNDTIRAPLCTTAEAVRTFGVQNEVAALCTSPLKLGEEQVRDLMAVAFELGACTGLYHSFDGQLATYIAFGAVTVEESGGRTSVFEVPTP